MTRVTHVLIIVAGLTLALGVALFFMMNARIGDLQKNARDKEAKVGSSEQIARRYETTLATYNATKARAQFLETSVSAKSYVPTLLQQLQGLAAQTHLTVDAVRPGPITVPVTAKPAASGDGSAAPSSEATTKKAPPPPYDTLGIDVDVTGSYAGTVAFLYGLTRFPKIISVDAAQITPGPGPAAGGARSSLLSTKMHLTAFVFHDSTAPVPAASPSAAVAGSSAGVPASPSSQAFLPSSHMVGDAAGHAASSAAGATKAAAARGQSGAQIM